MPKKDNNNDDDLFKKVEITRGSGTANIKKEPFDSFFRNESMQEAKTRKNETDHYQ